MLQIQTENIEYYFKDAFDFKQTNQIGQLSSMFTQVKKGKKNFSTYLGGAMTPIWTTLPIEPINSFSCCIKILCFY